MRQRLTKQQYIGRKRRRRRVIVTFILSFLLLLFVGRGGKIREWYEKKIANPMLAYDDEDCNLNGIKLPNGVVVRADMIRKNPYSRSGRKLTRVNEIVIHYVANPGSSAKNNRDYFDSLADKQDRYVSSHFVVGLDGEIIQCIPLNEVAYASNNRNGDTIAIEVCHQDKTGRFNRKTYRSVVSLAAYLCDMFQIDSSHIIRHYDVTGKLCPLYYVENEDKWNKLKENIQKELDNIERKKLK